MVRNLCRPVPSQKQDAWRLRAEADEVLRRLLANRESSERRHAEHGWRDPIKCITGRSALDEAISAVRDMISDMDALITGLEEGIDDQQREIAARHDQPMKIGSET